MPIRYERGRYRDAASGEELTADQVRIARDELADAWSDRFAGVVDQYVDGEIDRERFRDDYLQAVERCAIEGYVAGRGGIAAMQDADYDALVDLVEVQQGFAVRFLDDIDAVIAEGTGQQFIDLPGDWGEAGTVLGVLRAVRDQVVARARMYGGTVVQAFERGKTRALTANDLPGYPADGGTPCLSQCRCWWDIDETETAYECTWQTEFEGVCEGCQRRGSQWAPFVVAK